MKTQECQIELLDNLWLGFYDMIAVALEDGSELPIWASGRDYQKARSGGNAGKLLLVSRTPITKQRALEAQEQLKARSKIGWYYEIY